MSQPESFLEEPPPQTQPASPAREHFWAGLPSLFTAITYALVLTFGSFDFLGEDLRAILQVEFLVIHSFPFLGALAFLRQVLETKNKKEGKRGHFTVADFMFWGLLALYVGASFVLGWRGPIYFFAATVATYMGFWLKRFDPLALYHLGGRWVACFLFYFCLFPIFDLSNSVSLWRAEEKTFEMGFLYFLILGLLELFGFYDWAELRMRKTIKTMDEGDKKGI